MLFPHIDRKAHYQSRSVSQYDCQQVPPEDSGEPSGAEAPPQSELSTSNVRESAPADIATGSYKNLIGSVYDPDYRPLTTIEDQTKQIVNNFEALVLKPFIKATEEQKKVTQEMRQIQVNLASQTATDPSPSPVEHDGPCESTTEPHGNYGHWDKHGQEEVIEMQGHYGSVQNSSRPQSFNRSGPPSTGRPPSASGFRPTAPVDRAPRCACCGSVRHVAQSCEYIRTSDKMSICPNIEALAALPKSDSDTIVRIFKQGVFVSSPPEYFEKLILNIDLARAGRSTSTATTAATTASVSQSPAQN